MARVKIALRPETLLHRNAKAAVRARSLLGEKYVDLDPGDAKAPNLEPGATLTDNEKSVEIDRVIRASATLVDSLNRLTPSIEQAYAYWRGRSIVRIPAGNSGTLQCPSARRRTYHHNTCSPIIKSISAIIKNMRTRAPSVLDKVDRLTQTLEKILLAPDSANLKETLNSHRRYGS